MLTFPDSPRLTIATMKKKQRPIEGHAIVNKDGKPIFCTVWNARSTKRACIEWLGGTWEQAMKEDGLRCRKMTIKLQPAGYRKIKSKEAK